MVLQRRVDDVDFVDEISEVVVCDHGPSVPVGIGLIVDLRVLAEVEQLFDLGGCLGELLSCRRLEADSRLARRTQPHRGLEGDLSARETEEVIEVGLDRLCPTQEHVEQLHAARPIWASSSVSCCRRRSRVGWVENNVERLMPLANAGRRRRR
jgi:hypothetical protein